MTTPTPAEFDKLPRLDVVSDVDAAAWIAMSRDQKERYAEAHELGAKILAFVKQNGRSQIWYPTSTPADYDVLELVEGQLAVVHGQVVAAVAQREEEARG